MIDGFVEQPVHEAPHGFMISLVDCREADWSVSLVDVSSSSFVDQVLSELLPTVQLWEWRRSKHRQMLWLRQQGQDGKMVVMPGNA